MYQSDVAEMQNKCKTSIKVQSLSSYALIYSSWSHEPLWLKFIAPPFQKNKPVIEEVNLILYWCLSSIITSAIFTFRSVG